MSAVIGIDARGVKHSRSRTIFAGTEDSVANKAKSRKLDLVHFARPVQVAEIGISVATVDTGGLQGGTSGNRQRGDFLKGSPIGDIHFDNLARRSISAKIGVARTGIDDRGIRIIVSSAQSDGANPGEIRKANLHDLSGNRVSREITIIGGGIKHARNDTILPSIQSKGPDL